MSDIYGAPGAGEQRMFDPAMGSQDRLIDSTSSAESGGRSMWNFGEHVGEAGEEIVGYDVECTDGHIGKIDGASNHVDAAHLVVDTGWWIFGKKRVIPAAAVESIDSTLATVRLKLTKDQVRDAPDWHQAFDPSIEAGLDPFNNYYNRIF
jgi:hypothetical protein